MSEEKDLVKAIESEATFFDDIKNDAIMTSDLIQNINKSGILSNRLEKKVISEQNIDRIHSTYQAYKKRVKIASDTALANLQTQANIYISTLENKYREKYNQQILNSLQSIEASIREKESKLTEDLEKDFASIPLLNSEFLQKRKLSSVEKRCEIVFQTFEHILNNFAKDLKNKVNVI